MQIIFQDPYSALDPHQNVREIMAEPISVFEKLSEKEMEQRIVGLLEKVGMKADDMGKYAYEFSGGQRQRIGIARALSVHPEFLLCDEPISALDVSIQAQVVNVLEDLQKELGLTYLFVAHDLSMVRHISDRIGVMYLGKVVESGESDEVYDNPCLLTALAELADPRYMSVHGVFDAYREKEVKVWGLEDIKDTVNEGNIGLKGSPTRVKKSFTKQAKGAGTILNDLSDDEAVAAIVEKLQEKHII